MGLLSMAQVVALRKKLQWVLRLEQELHQQAQLVLVEPSDSSPSLLQTCEVLWPNGTGLQHECGQDAVSEAL